MIYLCSSQTTYYICSSLKPLGFAGSKLFVAAEFGRKVQAFAFGFLRAVY